MDRAAPTSIFLFGYSGFLVGRCELGCRIPFPSPSYDSRSVLAVKGSLRRAKRAPLTAPGRSEAHNLYEGKGIRGTSHLSTISASAPQSAFHRSTVLKCGRLLARSWPVPPTRNPEEPKFYALAVTHGKHVTSERGFDDADSEREGKPGTEKPKDQLPSYHLTTTANPLRTQPHSQSESVHNSGGRVMSGVLRRTKACRFGLDSGVTIGFIRSPPESRRGGILRQPRSNEPVFPASQTSMEGRRLCPFN